MSPARTAPTALPLAAASARLRGRPGRPRKGLDGHSSGITPASDRMDSGRNDSSLGPHTTRLLDVRAAAAYLGVSTWTVRDLEAAGSLPRVRVPLPNGRELRKLLFDVRDLDRLIETWKERVA